MALDYSWLHDAVRGRFDSDEAMEAFLSVALTPEELRNKQDDRYLSAMTRRVFQAGRQVPAPGREGPCASYRPCWR